MADGLDGLWGVEPADACRSKAETPLPRVRWAANGFLFCFGGRAGMADDTGISAEMCPSSNDPGSRAAPILTAGGARIVQRQAAVCVGPFYMLPLGPAWLRPTVAAGARTYLQRTELSSRVAGEPMGAWEETSTTLGWFGALGAEAQAGPGAVVVEAVAGSAALDGAIFEGAQSGSIDLLAGYRLAL